jgi:hypothetical protein
MAKMVDDGYGTELGRAFHALRAADTKHTVAKQRFDEASLALDQRIDEAQRTGDYNQMADAMSLRLAAWIDYRTAANERSAAIVVMRVSSR